MDPLLKKLESGGTYCQTFTDDVVLVFDGNIAQKIEVQARVALAHILAWGDMSMGGVNIVMSIELKILGVTLDNILTFNKHVTNVCRKAIGAYKQLYRAVRPGDYTLKLLE